MSYKLYSIIPSTSKGETIEVVTKMMKTPFSKYPKDLPLKNEKRADMMIIIVVTFLKQDPSIQRVAHYSVLFQIEILDPSHGLNTQMI